MASSGPTARVDSVFSEYDRPNSPGCALGVVRDGQLIYSRGYGMANLEHGIPIAPATVFDIGSTSKQFTAANIVLLAQEGKLSLDDPVRKWVPELRDYGEPVTIRQLLHHTSGLRDYLTLMSLAGISFDNFTTAVDALDIIARQRELNFKPGEQYLYSNSGYFLLSEIVERASGMPMREFAQERIFKPLGMNDTHFHDDHTMVVPRRATGYAPAAEEGEFRIDMSNFEQTGDGAVYTTVEDLARWDSNFYEPAVGGRTLLDTLHTRGILTSGDTLEYALGLIIGEHRGLPTVSHGGSWAGYRAELLRFPGQRFSTVVLCNLASTDPGTLAREVAEIYLAGEMEAPEEGRAASADSTGFRLPAAAFTHYAGTYRNPATGDVRRLTVADGKLVADAFGQQFDAVPLSSERFRLADLPVTLSFAFDDTGRAVRLLQSISGGDATEYLRIEPVTLSAAELSGYRGTYASEEIGTDYTLALENGALILRRPNTGDRTLVPTLTDEFVAGSLILRFTWDGSGRVTGFVLNAGRTQNLRFERRES
jgi:CubicO group peptidase (beta-lactamase class C family)